MPSISTSPETFAPLSAAPIASREFVRQDESGLCTAVEIAAQL